MGFPSHLLAAFTQHHMPGIVRHCSQCMDHVCRGLISLPLPDCLHQDHDDPIIRNVVRLHGHVRTGEVSNVVADQLLQQIWTRLHQVTRTPASNDLQSRYCFTIASISKAVCLLRQVPIAENNLIHALQCLDKALIMSPLHQVTINHYASEIHKQLPVLPLDGQSEEKEHFLPVIQKQIPIESEIDLMTFEIEYFKKRRPVVIRNALSHWPALDPSTGRKWSLSYLNRVAGHRIVPVEIGKKYTDQTWSQKLMSLNEFIKDYVINDGREASFGQKGYLAQYDLFHQIPELRKDISIPDFCSVCPEDAGDQSSDDSSERTAVVDTNVWLGPSATVSPLHFDPKDNILVQVNGYKYVRIYDRKTPAGVIYPHAPDSLLSNTSHVDVEDVDANKFPAFARCASDFMAETILQEGDALFIPCQTWHFVKSLTTSCSISFWWT